MAAVERVDLLALLASRIYDHAPQQNAVSLGSSRDFWPMQLFEPRERSEPGPSRYAEPHIDYLERTGRESFASVRNLMERWVTEVPHPHRRSLLSRLRSRDDHHFEAAFFELYLHALLRRLGFAVRCHPKAGNRGARPDFLVRRPASPGVLLEAATVDELSALDRATRSRLASVYDALNSVSSPDYFFHVRHYGELRSPLPGKRLRRDLGRFLAGLEYDEVDRLVRVGGLDATPKHSFEHDGFRLVIGVIPVSREKRGYVGHRPVGALGPGDGRWVNDWKPVRDKLKHKARKYGTIRRPLVIAINAAGRHLDKIDIMQALFGQESYVISGDLGSSDPTPVMERRWNGFWVGPSGPVNRRVSAVILVSSLLPWTIAVHEPVIYHNPWARYPLGHEFDLLESFRPVGSKMTATTGTQVRDLLGLPDPWPQRDS